MGDCSHRADSSRRAESSAPSPFEGEGRSEGQREPAEGGSSSSGHILDTIGDLTDEHWDVIQKAQFKDPAMSFLMMMEKARRVAGVSDGE